MTTTVEPVYIE